ncbi:MAG: anti-virulence regulator CigR family protein [Burkholderiales bacterium]|jgi:hypothetical protein|nr:anti-virulence regulator CigR family protein [Burkholderiales bacterium]
MTTSSRRALALATAIAVFAAMPGTAFAKNDKGQGGGPPGQAGGQGKGKGNSGNPGNGASDPAAIAASLTAASIRTSLGSNVGVLHIGAKPLPPGIQKNLARGKPLPPGIAKKTVPGGLFPHLPRVDGYEWIQVGTALVLAGVGTLIVKEIIENVFD